MQWDLCKFGGCCNPHCHSVKGRERLFSFEGNHLLFIYCEGWGWGTQNPKAFHSWFCCLIILQKSCSQQRRAASSSAEPGGLLPLQKVSLEVLCHRITLQLMCLLHLLYLFLMHHMNKEKCLPCCLLKAELCCCCVVVACHAQVYLRISIFSFKKQPCQVFPVVQSVTKHCYKANAAFCCLNRCGSSIVPAVSLIVKLFWICNSLFQGEVITCN